MNTVVTIHELLLLFMYNKKTNRIISALKLHSEIDYICIHENTTIVNFLHILVQVNCKVQ